MAKGSLTVFHAAAGYIRDNAVSIPSGASTNWNCALLSDPVTALLVGETTPALNISTNCNEVAATGNYVAKGKVLTLDNSDTSGVITMKLNTTTHTSGKITWTAAASSPTNIKTALIFDEDSTTDKAICYIDMTSDGGTTPISLVAGDISITFGTGGVAGDIMTITVNA